MSSTEPCEPEMKQLEYQEPTLTPKRTITYWFRPLFVALCVAVWIPMPVIQTQLIHHGGFSDQWTGMLLGIAISIHLIHGIWAAGYLAIGIHALDVRIAVSAAWLLAITLTSLWSSHWPTPAVYKEIVIMTAYSPWLSCGLLWIAFASLQRWFELSSRGCSLPGLWPRQEKWSRFSIAHLIALTCLIAVGAHFVNSYFSRGWNLYPIVVQMLNTAMVPIAVAAIGALVVAAILIKRSGAFFALVVAPAISAMLLFVWAGLHSASGPRGLYTIMYLSLIASVYFACFAMGYLMRCARISLTRRTLFLK